MTNEQRLGDWMQTVSGIMMHPLHPLAEEIVLEDIAHALSMICRFGGHVTRFYSVAEHSVLVSRVVETLSIDRGHSPLEVAQIAKLGLLHDAAEAYLGDMVRPLKRSMPEYRNAESRLESAIALKFNLWEPHTIGGGSVASIIKRADLIMLATEREQLMRVRLPWVIDEEQIKPIDIGVLGLRPEQARVAFMTRFGELELRIEKLRRESIANEIGESGGA